MTRLTALSLALTTAFFTPVAVVPVIAHAAEHPHCNTYTTGQEAGVTCTNPTDKAFTGKLVVQCASLDDPERVKFLSRKVTIPPSQENVLASVSCPAGTEPLPPLFTGPNVK